MERDMKAYLKKVGKQDHDFPLSGGRYEWQLPAYYTEE
jgi:hypothetical protein